LTGSASSGYAHWTRVPRLPRTISLLAAVAGFAVPSHAATPAQRCEQAAAKGLRSCFAKVATEVRHCYLDTGAACPAGDPMVAAALHKLETRVLDKCSDAASVQAAGYGTLLTPPALVARLREACLGEPATLAARTFGGPQAALLASATPGIRTCLASAYEEASRYVTVAFSTEATCLRQAHRGPSCNVARVIVRLGKAEAKLVNKLPEICPTLKDVLGMDAATYTTRARDQVGCMTATSHGDTAPLDLQCGPRPSVPVPPRGTWVQVVLPLTQGGPQCGDGSPYAFWLRLAPSGSPLEQVVTDMAPGGVCLFYGGELLNCAIVPANMLMATDDPQPSDGYLSTNPAVNPFSDWTMLYMPYCTQDLHIGGGLSSVFSPTFTVQRYGAINVRAALRYLRDVLWTALDDEDPQGWRPDRLRVLFGGESAGGGGGVANYHYPLDDLRWVHTTALPDSALGLDNGGVGVATLGTFIITETNPTGWGTRPFQPPYCLTASCVVVPNLLAATAVRLKAVPEQQILTLSNQNDSRQWSDTLFSDPAAWINALRTAYCANQGKTGLHYFLPAGDTPTHTMLRTDSLYTGLAAGGVVLRDFLAAAVADPNGVVDRVDEFVPAYPGVNPFACLGGSPSGAFVE
jgi:hypothetical protein